MTDATTFQQVQNGIDTGAACADRSAAPLSSTMAVVFAPTRTSTCSFRHTSPPTSCSGPWEPRVNPGNPYVGSTKQNGFGTFGGPDFAATLTAVARLALNSVWYQKWWIHLRHRPESGGAIVRQILSGFGNTIDGPREQTTSSTRRPSRPVSTNMATTSSRSPSPKARRRIRPIRPVTGRSPALASPS